MGTGLPLESAIEHAARSACQRLTAMFVRDQTLPRLCSHDARKFPLVPVGSWDTWVLHGVPQAVRGGPRVGPELSGSAEQLCQARAVGRRQGLLFVHCSICFGDCPICLQLARRHPGSVMRQHGKTGIRCCCAQVEMNPVTFVSTRTRILTCCGPVSDYVPAQRNGGAQSPTQTDPAHRMLGVV